jgi:hypothetical protein
MLRRVLSSSGFTGDAVNGPAGGENPALRIQKTALL